MFWIYELWMLCAPCDSFWVMWCGVCLIAKSLRIAYRFQRNWIHRMTLASFLRSDGWRQATITSTYSIFFCKHDRENKSIQSPVFMAVHWPNSSSANVAVEVLLHNREIPGSNVDPDTGYTYLSFPSFSWDPPESTGVVILIVCILLYLKLNRDLFL